MNNQCEQKAAGMDNSKNYKQAISEGLGYNVISVNIDFQECYYIFF